MNHLGCHPENGALHCCESSTMDDVFCPFGNSEIWNFARACHFDQDIVGFQILSQKSEKRKETNKWFKHTRWRIPFEWRYSNPLRIWAVNDLVTLSSNFPCLCKQLPTEPPGTYSKKLEERWETYTSRIMHKRPTCSNLKVFLQNQDIVQY